MIKQFKNNDSWGIPKGHINPGETLEECAVREVREETGVDVTLDVRLPDCKAKLSTEDKVVVSWLARPTGSHEIRLDDPDNEVDDARWILASMLPRIHQYQQPLVRYAVEQLRSQYPHFCMTPAIQEALTFVHGYAPMLDDWITIKKELLRSMHSEDRKFFSTRDPITKEQRTNAFERFIAERWSAMTGRAVVFKNT